MREFARFTPHIPPKNEAAEFFRLWAEHGAWSMFFFWRALVLTGRAVLLTLINWLFLAPVYWGEIILFLIVAVLAFIILL